MSIDIDKLEALARAADEGPWDTDTGGEVHKAGRTIYAWPRLSGPVRTGANMEYGAAADPTTILALIARLREAEASAAEHEQARTALEEALGQVKGERDELAAHAGDVLFALNSTTDEFECCVRVGKVVEAGPEASLARLKAEWQAEALEGILAYCRAVPQSAGAAGDVLRIVEQRARGNRRQAEQADTAGEGE